MPSISRFAVPAILALFAIASCAEEDTRLFDETGIWSLESYTLDGTTLQEIDQSRDNAFLLNFKPSDGVVAAANCYSEGGSTSVEGSTCKINEAASTWDCHCFAYTYDNDRMVWQEFEPGDVPPAVGPVSEEEGGATEIIVSEFGDAARTYQYDSLPADLFNSDGSIARHVFTQKAQSIWDVDLNLDETIDLEACANSCFPSGG